jgi:hypothetical protein
MDLKHFFVVKNGKQVFEDETLYKASLKRMEGYRGYLIMKTVKREITPGMYGYYFGHVIAECRNNIPDFAGWNYTDMHNHFWKLLRPGIDYTKAHAKDMIGYVEELIPWLYDKYGVVIQPDHKFSKVIS